MRRMWLTWLGGLGRTFAGLALLVLLALSARAYNGEYLFTRAQLGPKTISEYNSLLTNAWSHNPHQNEISLKMAKVLQTRNKWEVSHRVLLESAAGKNHWQGWELQGIVRERFAFTDAGTLQDAEGAKFFYNRVLLVHPSYIKGIERRALLGLKMGDWNLVRGLADQLITLDANNRNAVYLRARIAEGIKDFPLAMDLYGELSAGGAPPSSSLFTSAEIQMKVERIIKDDLR